jgi:hypothetical protein
MIDDEDELQSKNWSLIYDALVPLMATFGADNAFGEGDYWILDDNWGPKQHKICVFNLDILRPKIVYAVQDLIKKFPNWSVVVSVDVPGKEEVWPNMGLIIREHEIIDGLQRQYFPPEYQSIQYEGSRVGTDKD